MAEPKFIELMREETPEVNSAFRGLVTALEESGGLDSKTFQLVYLGIKASKGEVNSAAAHAGMAKKAGATREEVRGAVMISLMTDGVDGIASCLEAVLDSYDKT
ncbi:MAG: carboxymuconolactone decarboxylase family protein [Oscillospiraceae bacterium]|nr:carboxymuconolactone decarboxylase family protein [Oscillospiraceae bacterium]